MFPDKVAVIHGARRYTYRQFEERVNRLASALRSAGLAKHDRVAFLCPNIPAMLEAHYGVPGAGGIRAAINTRLSSDEIGYILGHSGASFLFVDAELAGSSSRSTSPVSASCAWTTPARPAIRTRISCAGATAPVPSWLEDEEETIAINYTSGTTGRPKGVMYSARGAYMNAIGELIESGMNFETRYLWTLPMFHCNGWCFTWAVTAVGVPHLPPAGRVGAHPGHARVGSRDPLQRRAHGADRRRQRSEGEEARALGDGDGGGRAALADTPGEAQGTQFPARPRLWPHRDLWAAHGVRVALGVGRAARRGAGAARRPSGPGIRGVRSGPGRRQRHARRAARRRDAGRGRDARQQRGEGLLRAARGDGRVLPRRVVSSGDIGVWHPDGYIELRDRKKDIIISGGENISTIEVEQAVAKHPAVLECAVVAIPDKKRGERPKAFVMLKAGAAATEADIIEFCRQHIARFKCPAAVEFGDLPKTSTGKIQNSSSAKGSGAGARNGSTEWGAQIWPPTTPKRSETPRQSRGAPRPRATDGRHAARHPR